MDTLTAANESALTFVTSVQEQVLGVYEKITPVVKNLTTGLPTLPGTPEPERVREIVEENFAFSVKVLDANKAFALGLVKAWTPEASK